MAVERLAIGVDRIAFLDRGFQLFEQKGLEAVAAAGGGVERFQHRRFDRSGEIGHPARVVDLVAGIADPDDDHLVEAARSQTLTPARLGEGGEHRVAVRSEEHTSELQSLMRISYAGFCLKTKTH